MPPSDANIESAIERAGKWLLRNQDPERGGWAERKGDSPSALNTAEVLLALISVRDKVRRAGGKIRAGAEFLVQQQTTEGPNAGAWERYVNGQPVCPDILRTSLAVEALTCISEAAPLDGVYLGTRWLMEARNSDGGWGMRPGAESDVLMTCFATSALLTVVEADAEDCEGVIRDALAFLVAAQRPSGSFDPEGSSCGIRTAYSALCLQRAERCSLSVHAKAREDAVTWLEENPTAAIKEIELTIEIDPDRTRPHADYAFVFMTEAVVVRLLSESPDEQVRQGRLVREALEAMFRSMDPDGGFFGQRVFSWSTARATYALGAARDSFDRFPEAPRLPAPQQVGRELLLFGVLSLVAVFVLSALGVFGPLQAVVVTFLVLALLLAYGRLSEAGFVEVFKALWQGRGRDTA
ncbi:MAG TPA: prenyltransferase/squalene oxidase repeat-containing protein [Solirubrobacterales bacterium]